MKALIYKEFKLSMHPICYIFVAAFPLMVLIPSYPLGIGFIYILVYFSLNGSLGEHNFQDKNNKTVMIANGRI